MENKLVILGAGQQGRICKRLAEELNIEVVAFVDNYVEGKVEGVKIYTEIEEVPNYKEMKYIVAIGDIGARRKFINQIDKLELDPITLIDPSAQIEEGAEIGKGNYIYKFVTVYKSAKIGDHNIINTKSLIATDAVIGNNCNICMGANVCGGCHVGDNSTVGYNSTIVSGYNVGENVKVEGNSIVYMDVPDNQYVHGIVKE